MTKVVIGTDNIQGTDLGILNMDFIVELFEIDKDKFFYTLGNEMEYDYPVPYAKDNKYSTSEYPGSLIVDGEFFALNEYDGTRGDPRFVALVEKYGVENLETKYGGFHLKVVEVPDGVDWCCYYPDVGPMYVSEKSRFWS